MGLSEAILGIKALTKIDPERFSVLWCLRRDSKNPFIILVGIILSQNTSDENAIRALKNLVERSITTPEKALVVHDKVIEDAIRISGMHRIKTRTIKELAKACIQGLDLNAICREDVDEARRKLMSVRGIGRKTADVYLASYCGMNVFPVDRHILRVTRRVLGNNKIGYNEASAFWTEFFKKENLYEMHLRMIEIGREYCKPRRPKCWLCPLKEFCRSRKYEA